MKATESSSATVIEQQDDCFMDIDDAFDFNETKKSRSKVGKARDRRVTMSPASARSMVNDLNTKRRQSIDLTLVPLLDIYDDEPVATSSVPDLPKTIDDFTKVSTSCSITVTADFSAVDKESDKQSANMSEDSHEIAMFKSELDALLAPDDASPADRTDEDYISAEVFGSLDLSMNPNNALIGSLILSEPHSEDFDETVHVNGSQPDDDIRQEPHPCDSDLIDDNISEEEYIRRVETSALARLRIRLEQAWWKYHWEMVSAQTVIQAKRSKLESENSLPSA